MRETIIILLFVFLQTFSTVGLCQKIENIKIEQHQLNAVVYYDLISDTNFVYNVDIYYSEDGGTTFSQKLNEVRGDVNSGVVAGKNKKIEWAVAEEVGAINSEIIFKITANKIDELPEPISLPAGRIRLDEIKREGDIVHIHYYFRGHIIKETDLFEIPEAPTIILGNDQVVFPIYGFMGEVAFNKDMTVNSFTCKEGLDKHGYIRFRIDKSIRIIQDLYIPIRKRKGVGSYFHFENVAIE